MQQRTTHPLVKSLILPLRKVPIFQGVAPRHKIFTSSCVIPLWDSATAHSLSGKELNPSSLEESCFSGLTVLLMFSNCPVWALFGLVLTHILIKSICVFVLSVVYFYSERPPLSEIFCFIFGLFLYFYSERPPLPKIFYSMWFYVWSLSIAKDRRFAEECSLRLWWS